MSLTITEDTDAAVQPIRLTLDEGASREIREFAESKGVELKKLRAVLGEVASHAVRDRVEKLYAATLK